MSDKKLIIFDIDETLLYASKNTYNPRNNGKPDFIAKGLNVIKRPHLERLLNYCLTHFKVGIWTSASKRFAYEVVSHLFKSGCKLEFIWSEEHCDKIYNSNTGEVSYIKDLSKILKFHHSIENTFIVEDTPSKIALQPQNVIPIEPFTGQAQDCELVKLIDRLKYMEPS